MLRHIATDLHQVYLTEMEAQIKPTLGKPASSSGGDKPAAAGGADEQIKKQARQLVYDTRYKARRENIPLERAFSQALQNSSASAPVKDLAKGMLFKEEVEELEEAPKTINRTSNKKNKVLVTPVKGFGTPYRRYASDEKKYKLRKNPQISSVVGTSYGIPYEGERKSGEQTAAALQSNPKAKKDFDKDGKIETPKQEWKGSRDKAIKSSIAAKKPVKEGFSNWREDLIEVMDTVTKKDSDKTIKEKPVDNYKGGKNSIVKVHPEVTEAIRNLGGELIEMVEVQEYVITEEMQNVTEYFYDQGLNEYGVNIVVEKLGLDGFLEFAYDISEEFLITEATRSARRRKPSKDVDTLKAEISARDEEKKKRRVAVKTAAVKQPDEAPKKNTIAQTVAKHLAAGIERHNKANADLKKMGAATRVTAGKIGQAAQRFAKGFTSEALVYGGEKKEPEDTRLVVTNADKKANTPAWQRYKSGDKGYKAADHIGEEKFDEATAMAKRGLDEPAIRTKIAQSTGGGKSADRATALANTNTYGASGTDPKARQRLAATQRGNFRDTTSSNPGLHGSGHQSTDPAVKAKQAARGAQRSALTPNERKQLNMGDDSSYLETNFKKRQSNNEKAIEDMKNTKAHKDMVATARKKFDEAVITPSQGVQKPGQQPQQKQQSSSVNDQQAQKDQELQAQKAQSQQTHNAQAKLSKILAARKNLQQVQQQAIRSGVTNIASSFKMDGEMVEAWYSGKGKTRTTASGRSVRWDEDDATDNAVSDRLQRQREAEKKQAAKQKLAAKGITPIKKKPNT